jgi:hypothetical protein
MLRVVGITIIVIVRIFILRVLIVEGSIIWIIGITISVTIISKIFISGNAIKVIKVITGGPVRVLLYLVSELFVEGCESQ